MSKQGQGSGNGQSCPNECGYDPNNRLHQEDNWKALVDPRNDNMKYHSQHYRAIDRQISENHQTQCLGKPSASQDGKK